jgi:hypothetical protein
MNKCKSCGQDVSVHFDQESIEYKGFITDLTAIDEVSRDVEELEIFDGMPMYYYYEEETMKYIINGEPPTGAIRGVCEECLIRSFETDEPHYGDGVYFTQHGAIMDPATSDQVFRSHGIPRRKYKAVYICNQKDHFRKIMKTGGVFRSKVHNKINDNTRIALKTGVAFQISLNSLELKGNKEKES